MTEATYLRKLVVFLCALLCCTDCCEEEACERLDVSSSGITANELNALKKLPSSRWWFTNKRSRLAGLNAQLLIWQPLMSLISLRKVQGGACGGGLSASVIS